MTAPGRVVAFRKDTRTKCTVWEMLLRHSCSIDRESAKCCPDPRQIQCSSIKSQVCRSNSHVPYSVPTSCSCSQFPSRPRTRYCLWPPNAWRSDCSMMYPFLTFHEYQATASECLLSWRHPDTKLENIYAFKPVLYFWKHTTDHVNLTVVVELNCY